VTDETNKSGALSPLKQAYLALEEMKSRVEALEQARHEPIAVIGIGCRFPGGANDPEQYWRLIIEGEDAVSDLPAGRWDFDRFYDPDPNAPGKTYSRSGGYLQDVDRFDPAFFGIAPREANGMDPQQRLLMEVSWEALEHAAQPCDRLKGSKTGVFFGLCSNDYCLLQVKSDDAGQLDAYFASGIAHSIGSGRVSYVLGLQGPSLSVDTACSSSLVAVHLACQSLRNGECRMALAGGVNAILSHENAVAFSKLRILSSSGRCRSFDAAADGIARGEGCGVVVLKRLGDAMQDGDRILAVIRGSAVNQDGASSGITAPSGPAQEIVLREALSRACVEPDRIGYLEAHGTGTILGDPIEMQAVASVLGKNRSTAHKLEIGSVKANIGHLEAAAGIAGFIKAVLVVQKGEIPPLVHFRTPNPHIAWEELPVSVPVSRKPWPQPGERIAGVSSFGFSGTNAHVVVAAVPPSSVSQCCRRPGHVLCLSAHTKEALAELAGRYKRLLEERSDEFMDLAFTSCVGRAHLPQRLAVCAADAKSAGAALASYLQGAPNPAYAVGECNSDPSKIAFLFTGQGAQYPNMGSRLFELEPVFRAAMERCDEGLRGHLSRRLIDMLFAPEPEQALADTGIAQPALFAIEYSLATLWHSWGVHPQASIGHSVGEYVAACLAGVFSLEDALKVVAARGRLMQALPRNGSMAAVFAPEERVAALLEPYGGRLAIAAVNSPLNTVVSGETPAVVSFCGDLDAAGIGSQPLRVSHAFHSPLMAPMVEEFARIVSSVTLHAPHRRIISNLTGNWADASQLTSVDYWARHVLAPVRFAAGVGALFADGFNAMIEAGPNPTLLGLVRQSRRGDSAMVLVPSLRRGEDDWEQMARSVSTAHASGIAVDWQEFHRGCDHRKTSLPNYPFQRKRYWIRETVRSVAGSAGRQETVREDILGCRLASPNHEVATFESHWNQSKPEFVTDHRIGGLVVVPASAYLCAALAAVWREFGQARCRLDSINIGVAMVLEENQEVVAQTILGLAGEPKRVEIHSAVSGSGDIRNQIWRRHLTAQFGLGDVGLTAPGGPDSLDRIRARCQTEVSCEEHYRGLRERGLDFGPRFRGVDELVAGLGEGLGRVRRLVAAPSLPEGPVDPVMLDAALQVVAVALRGSDEIVPGAAYLPIAIDYLLLREAWPDTVISHARLRRSETVKGQSLVCDLRVFDPSGRVLTEVSGLLFKRLEEGKLSKPAQRMPLLYAVDWVPSGLKVSETTARRIQPAAVVRTARLALSTLRQEVGMGKYDLFWRQLEALCPAYIWQALQPWSEPLKVGDLITVLEMETELGVAARHQRLLRRLVEILAEDGWLARVRNDEWRVKRKPESIEDPTPSIRALQREFPGNEAQADLVCRCGAQLRDTLRGRVDPLELLFPGGSTAEAEELYSGSPFAQLYRRLARMVVEAVVTASQDGHPLTVLEIGGGTGGTTGVVLSAIPDESSYVFTDISPAFLSRARERFADHPFVSYRLLDIERSPSEQGFGQQTFDLVIAASMIHATRDLGQSLSYARQLLQPGGLLMLLEGTRPERWIDLTFGLTAGWWRFDDSIRTNYPLLSRERWLELLADTGFEQTETVPTEDDGSTLLLTRRTMETLELPEPTKLKRPGKWLLIGKPSEIRHVVDAVRRRGYQFEFMDLAAQKIGAVHSTASGIAKVMADAVKGGDGTATVVLYLGESEGPADRAAEINAVDLLHVIQALVSLELATPPRLVVVTTWARDVGREQRAINLAQAPLWSLGRVIAEEHPEFGCLLADLGSTPCDGEVEALLDAIESQDPEDQIAIRPGAIWVPRLQPISGSLAPVGPRATEQFRVEGTELVVKAPGDIDSIELVPARRRAPAIGEIEVEVEAAGLGFRDVLNVVGMRQDRVPLGSEFAGRVVGVGGEVGHFQLGDRVVGVSEGAFRSFLTVPATWAAGLPTGLRPVEGAALPSAYLTAAYALEHLGRLARGEKVLIHAAAGGVGLAAVRLAQRAGAELFVTAGSPEKRAYLQSQGLAHVYDSRTVEFADQIRRIAPNGLDLVLNSLTGASLTESLALLADGGRFLEIGKHEVLSKEEVSRLIPRIGYHAIDMVQVCRQNPSLVAEMLAKLMADVGSRALPCLPVRTYAPERAAEAIEFMARARHVGKLVLNWRRDSVTEATDREAAIRPEATYLITGGLGGLGLVTAEWLVNQGARYLLLMGRGSPSTEASKVLARLKDSGAEVTLVRGDVAEVETVNKAIAMIPHARPLRGVVHSAGILDDGVIVQQSAEKFLRVFAPKIRGAWNLHELTRNLPLDFFVLYSSTASVLGSPGQANHAAANAFLDALAQERHRLGLPALSINWGAWSEVGAASALGVRGDRHFEKHGLEPITPREGVEALNELVLHPQARAYLTVAQVDWHRYAAGSRADGTSRFFCQVLSGIPKPAVKTQSTAEPNRETLQAKIRGAGPNERVVLMRSHVQAQVARVLGLDPNQALDRRRPLSELGLDSLMAVELRNLLAGDLAQGQSLPATLIFKYPTIDSLASYLSAELEVNNAPGAEQATPASTDEKELEALSEEEARKLLADELKSLGDWNELEDS